MSLGERVLDLLFPPKCPFCQKILDDPRAPLCLACQLRLPWLEGKAGERRVDFAESCFSPLAYRDDVPGAVHRYKFSGVRALGKPLALLMAQCLKDHLPQGADLICWAPLSRKRLRKRGFDQAQLLAEESARRANARGAYALLPGIDLTGKRVVLVDDVVTSGATLSECAGLLRMGGAEGVWCLTAAQARRDGKSSAKKEEK